MKMQFEPEDIEEIARRVAECLKPLFTPDTSKEAEDEILTVEQVARLLKTSRGQIYQWVNNSQHCEGDFPYLKAGRLLRFSKKAALRWLETKRNR